MQGTCDCQSDVNTDTGVNELQWRYNDPFRLFVPAETNILKQNAFNPSLNWTRF
jgi:hypothetical protein